MNGLTAKAPSIEMINRVMTQIPDPVSGAERSGYSMVIERTADSEPKGASSGYSAALVLLDNDEKAVIA